MATTTDLYNAIEENNLEEVKLLYADSDGFTLTDSHPWSEPLFQAAGLGHTEIVRYLLENHDLFVDDGDDTTWFSPLMAASENGYLEITKLLLKHGADVNRQYEKECESDASYATGEEQGYPLTLAVDNGHTEIVRLLLEYGADVDCIKYDYNGSYNSHVTPLMLAMQSNNLEISELLIANDANCCAECRIDGEAHTPLSYCIARADTERVQSLLNHGANPNALAELEDIGKMSAFMYAVYLGATSKNKLEERYDIVVMLMKHGVALSVVSDSDYATVLDLVLDLGNERYLRLFGLQTIKETIAELEENEQQEDILLPDFLELTIGSEVSHTFKVFLDADTLVWQVFDPNDKLLDTKLLPAKERDWERFWMLCDMAGIWYWRQSFKGPDIYDSKRWSVHIGFRGKEAYASGVNAFPVDEDYPECQGYTPLFRKFLRAVNDLLRGLPFE